MTLTPQVIFFHSIFYLAVERVGSARYTCAVSGDIFKMLPFAAALPIWQQ